jgi:hypothetical protein
MIDASPRADDTDGSTVDEGVRAMITGETEFEAALKEADGLLHPPPAEGSPEHARFMDLLKDIAAYRPNIFTPAEPAINEERARLAKHLDAFEARMKPHYGPHWETLLGGNFRFK